MATPLILGLTQRFKRRFRQPVRDEQVEDQDVRVGEDPR